MTAAPEPERRVEEEARTVIYPQLVHDAVGVCRDLAAVLRENAYPTSDVRWYMLQQRAEAVVRSLPPSRDAAACGTKCKRGDRGCGETPCVCGTVVDE